LAAIDLLERWLPLRALENSVPSKADREEMVTVDEAIKAHKRDEVCSAMERHPENFRPWKKDRLGGVKVQE